MMQLSKARDDALRHSPCEVMGVGCRVSVVLPVFNESALVGRVVEAILAFTNGRPEFHFLFVDDGSTDGTAETLRILLSTREGRGVDLVAYRENRGKGHAVRLGLSKCKADLACFTDGDLAYSLDHLGLLEEALRTHDIAIGSRSLGRPDAHAPAIRRLLSLAFNALIRLTLGLPYRDTQAGLKGFREPVATRLAALQRVEGPGFDAELLFLARKFGYSIAEIPVRPCSEHAYKTDWRKLVINSLRMLRDALLVRIHDLAGHYD